MTQHEKSTKHFVVVRDNDGEIVVVGEDVRVVGKNSEVGLVIMAPPDTKEEVSAERYRTYERDLKRRKKPKAKA